MTIAEAEEFYKRGKIYFGKRVLDLSNWLNESIKDGYRLPLNIQDLEELVKRIVNWYEIKYPGREFGAKEGLVYTVNNVDSISKYMDVEQLMFRLYESQANFLNCLYRGTVFTNGKNHDSIATGVNIKRKDVEDIGIYELPEYFVILDCFSGEVEFTNFYDKYELPNEYGMQVEEMLKTYEEKYSDDLDLSELKKLIFIHETDIELRHRLLQLVALKLLYSENTIPEYGYKRAKLFINEFNEKFDLTLSSEEIDELMSATKLTRKNN